MKKKIVSICIAAALAATAVIGGTLAYLTSKDEVVNTFTVGNVKLTLDETAVNPDGTEKENANGRVKANAYHLLPGHEYIKDPTVTVEAGSEESYVRMMVTVNYSAELDTIFAPGGANLTSIFKGYDPNNWALNGITKDTAVNTRTYEFRYIGSDYEGPKGDTVAESNSDTKLDPLFDSFTIPGDITNDQLATLITKDASGEITNQFKITVVAHAIQADGFADAAAAWAAFDA